MGRKKTYPALVLRGGEGNIRGYVERRFRYFNGPVMRITAQKTLQKSVRCGMVMVLVIDLW